MDIQTFALVVSVAIFFGLLIGSLIWTVSLTRRIPSNLDDISFEPYKSTKSLWWWR
jgi:hypothetical protein